MIAVEKSQARESEAKVVACPDCGRPKMRRMTRLGFLQEKLWPLFGYYPWKCRVCRKTRMLRYRGKKRSKKSQSH